MKIACHRCSAPTENADGVCDSCRSTRSPQASPYWEAEWKQRSSAFLRKNPWCVLCLASGPGGRVRTPATVADHWPHTRRELLARGIADPDTEDRLRPLCASHHATRGRHSTMRFDNDPA